MSEKGPTTFESCASVNPNFQTPKSLKKDPEVSKPGHQKILQLWTPVRRCVQWSPFGFGYRFYWLLKHEQGVCVSSVSFAWQRIPLSLALACLRCCFSLPCLHPFQSIPSSFVLPRRRSPSAWSYLDFCRRGQNVAPTKPSFHYFPNAPSITSLNTHFPLVYPRPPISLPCTLFEVGNCWEPLMRRYATHLFLVPLSTICTSLLQGVRKIVPSRFLCAFKMH